MEWINLLQNLGIFSVIITGLSWLLKKYFEKILDKDIEKFKSVLQVESERSKIRYEKIHSERVDVIKNIYKKIVNTQKDFSSLMNPLQLAGELTEQEKQKKAAESANDLIDYFDENRIFFHEYLAKEIDLLLSLFKEIWSDFQSSRISKKINDHKTMLDQWNNSWKQIQEKVPEIKNTLEEKFRNIIGINHEN